MADELIEIPLFPLNMVLFPGMAQPLHIFEPRYRQMTAYSLDTNVPFGIVLALPESASEQEQPAHVGALARIVDYMRLPDGRYNLLTVGAERFEIVEVRHNRSYLTGMARIITDDSPEDADLDELTERARAALEEYLRLMLTLIGSENREITIPKDPSELSFLIAGCLTCEDDEKQTLLELRSVSARLRKEITLLCDETAELTRQLKSDYLNPHDGDRASLN
ncbi:MAG TPA: LON peptidase substrate-binding domain-containing protein [Ktedonobacterales bacterium]|nr:LON peptidase substrate-binding domain-containing protein [Ktedonobacterales bacterium]